MKDATNKCGFYVEKSRKYCSLTRKKGEEYCGQHVTERNGRKRVACPYTNAHTMWEDSRDHHMAICRQRPVENTDPWFQQDVNIVGGESSDEVDFEKWTPIIEKAFEATDPVRKEIRHHDGVQERLDELGNDKHAAQQSSLISHMDENGFLKHGISEFGCGRGELSRYISRAQSHSLIRDRRYLLVDRASPRRKLDNKIVEDAANKHEDVPKVQRVLIDIKDLNLDTVLNEETCIVSKHLCGCATDLTLECARRSSKVVGIAIALCCRQVCSYETFPQVGKKFLSTHGITAEGFKTLSRMTSWAVSGQDSPLGIKARRLIDHARMLSVQEMGYTVKLVEYIDPSKSLENVCLIATK